MNRHYHFAIDRQIDIGQISVGDIVRAGARNGKVIIDSVGPGGFAPRVVILAWAIQINGGRARYRYTVANGGVAEDS